MATLSSIAVDLVAKTAKFDAGLQRSGKQITGFTAHIQGLKSKLFTVRNAAIGLTAALGVGKIVSGVKGQLEYVDALAKTADKIGVTTEDLATLRFAGEQTGVSVQTMDMALQRMTRRLAEAAMGTGEAQGALEELGLDAQHLMNLSLFERFSAIATALGGVQNEADKVRLAFKLFDSEGVALKNTLAVGAEGLAAYRNEATQLGIAISRDAAAKVEAANDAFNRMDKAVSSVWQNLGVAFAPALENIADVLSANAPAIQQFMATISAAISGVVNSIDALLNPERTSNLRVLLEILRGGGRLVTGDVRGAFATEGGRPQVQVLTDQQKTLQRIERNTRDQFGQPITPVDF